MRAEKGYGVPTANHIKLGDGLGFANGQRGGKVGTLDFQVTMAIWRESNWVARAVISAADYGPRAKLRRPIRPKWGQLTSLSGCLKILLYFGLKAAKGKGEGTNNKISSKIRQFLVTKVK